MTADAARMRSHWWPRPGWAPGRLIYTWHITFDGAEELHRLAADYQRQLAPLPELNLVPREWLHLTVQGVGYTDEVALDRLQAVTDAVTADVGKFGAFDATFTRPVVVEEAIVLPPEPTESFQKLLAVIRSAMASVLGENQVPIGPEQTHGFRPHVSIAYSAGDHDAEPYRAALGAIAPEPATVRIGSLSLIRQERLLAPDWLYRWDTEATAPMA